MGFFKLLLAFLPWIAFKIIAPHSMFCLKAGVVVSLGIAVIMAFTGIHKGFILVGGLLFFGFSLVSVVIMENIWIMKHIGILATGTLFFLSLISLLVRHPFTLTYARANVDRKDWNSSDLVHKSYVITSAWTLVFLINVLINVYKLYHTDIKGFIYEIAEYSFLMLGILFTMYYPKLSLRRREKNG